MRCLLGYLVKSSLFRRQGVGTSLKDVAIDASRRIYYQAEGVQLLHLQ